MEFSNSSTRQILTRVAGQQSSCQRKKSLFVEGFVKAASGLSCFIIAYVISLHKTQKQIHVIISAYREHEYLHRVVTLGQ